MEKWGKKRDKEKEMLKKELEKRKMPLIGLEDRKKSKKDESKKDNAPEEGETKKSKNSKIKKLLHSEKADKTKGTGGTRWEPTDPNVAEVTIASSTANAQKEAERLKAGG